jgi:tripartite-type tricarboxylate transporter receptor subunit TctC
MSRLKEELSRLLNRADVKERFLSSGTDTVSSSPEQLASTMKSEIVRLSKLIKDAGIRED